MVFPVQIHIGNYELHPHFIFDVIAYFTAYQIYRIQKKKIKLSSNLNHSIWFLISAILGAFLLSKSLAWLEHPEIYLSILLNDELNLYEKAIFLNQGKTIVGGIIGGWIGVEIYKKKKLISSSSGDCYALPLCVGMIIGRIGCFLSGLEDKTHGVSSSFPWAVDFGDNIPRHPTQIYEILFLFLFLITLYIFKEKIKNTLGLEFKIFVFAYLLFRFLIEFIKPIYLYPWGLSMIQTFCLFVLIYLFIKFKKLEYYAD